jgi:hypothetical protein
MFEQVNGPVPEGMVLDHAACDRPGCVNPSHLAVVTPRENILCGRGLCAVNARKTHCKWGHAFSEENTYSYRGHRYCKACLRERKRRDGESARDAPWVKWRTHPKPSYLTGPRREVSGFLTAGGSLTETAGGP